MNGCIQEKKENPKSAASETGSGESVKHVSQRSNINRVPNHRGTNLAFHLLFRGDHTSQKGKERRVHECCVHWQKLNDMDATTGVAHCQHNLPHPKSFPICTALKPLNTDFVVLHEMKGCQQRFPWLCSCLSFCPRHLL